MLFCILKRKYDYTLKVPELSCPVWWLISLWKFGADLTNKTFHSLNFSSNNSNLTRNKAVICPSIPIRFVHVQYISQNCKVRQAGRQLALYQSCFCLCIFGENPLFLSFFARISELGSLPHATIFIGKFLLLLFSSQKFDFTFIFVS